MSTFADAFVEPEAAFKAAVMHQTWGHLKVDRRKRHRGYILFTAGEYRDLVVIKSDFGDCLLYTSDAADDSLPTTPYV